MLNWFKRKKPQVTVATYQRKNVDCSIKSNVHQALLADFRAKRGHDPKGMAR